MRGKFNMQSGAINGPLATQKVPDVSQGSVATRLMCDGVFSDDFVIFTYLLTYLLTFAAESRVCSKRISKSVFFVEITPPMTFLRLTVANSVVSAPNRTSTLNGVSIFAP